MASLRKRTGSPCWYLDWHEHPGNKGRRVLCTGIRHNNAKNPPRQGAAWDILLAKEGELSRRKFGLPASIKDSAVEAFLTAHLHWLKTTSADISPGTLQRYNSTVIVFNRWASAERLSHFSQFTYDTIGRFVLHRSGNKSSKTVAMDCAFMGQVWDEAKNRSLVTFEKNPWRELRPASIKSTARRPLTAAEISHLFLRPLYRRTPELDRAAAACVCGSDVQTGLLPR